jgi:hypothetical protein
MFLESPGRPPPDDDRHQPDEHCDAYRSRMIRSKEQCDGDRNGGHDADSYEETGLTLLLPDHTDESRRPQSWPRRNERRLRTPRGNCGRA